MKKLWTHMLYSLFPLKKIILRLLYCKMIDILEFHHRYGKLFRTRVPTFGRDLAYHFPSCDLYIAAYGNEIYRLNLEQGRFLNPIKTNSNEVTCCEFNPEHQLFTCGTGHGHVECWDPRTRFRVGTLDCAIATYQESNIESVPQVTSLKYKDGLNLGVGTSCGQVLLYDIRSKKPYLVKDHNYELPIKSIQFQPGKNIVLSMDKRIMKMWDGNTNLGSAPSWCSYLDNITEELEETSTPQVYEDFQFVTRAELEEIGLSDLIGKPFVKAFMHGFFMDVRLYKKAKSVSEPFARHDYEKKRVQQMILEKTDDRVKSKYKRPTVNKELAQKMQEQEKDGGLLKDDRFASLFHNPDFARNKESREYRMMNHNVARLDMDKKKKAKIMENFEEVDGGKPKKKENPAVKVAKQPKFFEIKEGDSLNDLQSSVNKPKKSKLPLEERIKSLESKSDSIKYNSSFGAKEMTYIPSMDDKAKKQKQDQDEHRKTRAKLRRSAHKITKHKIAPMWKSTN
ncbi:hypothetical protein EB796_011023 [Bugula neritina]|uniref:NOL10 n=1 Tax=Bugula neritina TaxID=10212 RepID=A0A7J7JXQ1_BUGNE|nr:hypothetical protein EB796_011023 [Bugula neritina]